MSWSVTASDTSVGSVTLAAGTTVLVVAISWSTGTLTYVRWDGTDMTLAVSIVGTNNAAAVFFMNRPTITTGAVTADVTMNTANALSITGTIGETAVAGDTDTNSSGAGTNDFLSVSVATVTGDIVFYAGDKHLGGNWNSVDVNYGHSAIEVHAASPTVGTWGDVDDQQMCCCAVALGIKPIARSNIIVVS